MTSVGKCSVLPGALAVLLAATPVTPPPPPDPASADANRVRMEKDGYVAVPLIQDEEGGGFVVECRSGKDAWRMLLDTGAESSSLDLALVRKLGLKLEGEVTGVGIEGTRAGREVSLRGFSMGAFDTRDMANTLSCAAFDFTAMNASRRQLKRPRLDGLLGHSFLRLTAAVVDYPAKTLYVRTPLAGLWPSLEGTWVAAAGEEDGRPRRIDPSAPPRVEFKNRRVALTDGPNRHHFGIHVRPGKDAHAVALFPPGQEHAGQTAYRAGGLLRVSGDRLSLCLCLDVAKARGFPTDFKAPAGSGRLVLECKKEAR